MEHDVYFQMYQETWKFHKKYFSNIPRQKDDKTWEQLINEANAICEKYKKLGYRDFVVSLLQREILELEKLSKLCEQQKAGVA